MFDFCPHCSQSIQQEQVPGRMLVCEHCGKDIGFVGAVQLSAVDETDELIRAGAVARCPVCQQAVAWKAGARTLVPHYVAGGARKICPGSGKPVTPVAHAPGSPGNAPGSPGKDLRSLMTRDVIRTVSCVKDAEPRIEVLTLEYLDKSERVRIQIEALRAMLGADFRLRDYPPSLRRPHLAVWGDAAACFVAAKHAGGGFQSLADADLAGVLADLKANRSLFFA